MRGHSEPRTTAQFGSCAINQLTFDASSKEIPMSLVKFSSLIFTGTLLAVASNDGTVKMHMIDNQKVTIKQ